MSEHAAWWVESGVIHIPDGQGGARHGHFDQEADAERAVRTVNSHAALLVTLEELVESHEALLNPASNRGEPAIGSALVDRLGAAWKTARDVVNDARKEPQ